MAAIAYVIARPDLTGAGTRVVFFGAVYVLERGAIEFWKTFLRNEDQSKVSSRCSSRSSASRHGRGKRFGIGLAVAGR